MTGEPSRTSVPSACTTIVLKVTTTAAQNIRVVSCEIMTSPKEFLFCPTDSASQNLQFVFIVPSHLKQATEIAMRNDADQWVRDADRKYQPYTPGNLKTTA